MLNTGSNSYRAENQDKFKRNYRHYVQIPVRGGVKVLRWTVSTIQTDRAVLLVVNNTIKYLTRQ